jgi:hypothetical protein
LKTSGKRAFEFGGNEIGMDRAREMYNGRFAMFLWWWTLTEYRTDLVCQAQVEEMLRIAGIVGFDE